MLCLGLEPVALSYGGTPSSNQFSTLISTRLENTRVANTKVSALKKTFSKRNRLIDVATKTIETRFVLFQKVSVI